MPPCSARTNPPYFASAAFNLPTPHQPPLRSAAKMKMKEKREIWKRKDRTEKKDAQERRREKTKKPLG
jgi:hypothetical protein